MTMDLNKKLKIAYLLGRVTMWAQKWQTTLYGVLEALIIVEGHYLEECKS